MWPVSRHEPLDTTIFPVHTSQYNMWPVSRHEPLDTTIFRKLFHHSSLHHISCAHEPETKSKLMNRTFVRDMMTMKMRQSVAPLLKTFS